VPEKWRPYICKVNDSLASILVDLALVETAPIASKPWLLWVWVYFRTPRADGLSDSKEAPTLYKIEDALTAEVSQKCRAIACGRITTEGRREFYFYGETQEGLIGAVKAALAGFEGYNYDLGEKEDPSWTQYLDVLFPSSEDLQKIGNQDFLENLESHGDVHTVEREVRHWMYFRSNDSRQSFKKAVSNAGFRILSESNAKGDYPFGIAVARTQSVEQEVIDETVIQLLHLSQEFDGEYDGWETQVVTQ
jgi:uncharacterized protein (TIGR01619 family)